MEERNDKYAMLDLMFRPAFCVEDNIITYVNQPAHRYMLSPGVDIRSLIATGAQEYAGFSDGCLYLTLLIAENNVGVSIVRMENMDIFMLDQEEAQSELRALALAAKELREPLAGVITVTDRLIPLLIADNENPKVELQTAQLNRRLFQMMRMVSNMSDALTYSQNTSPRMEYLEIGRFFDEILAKCQDLFERNGMVLHYTGLEETVYTLACSERLERAIYNLLSNASKFSPRESVIDVQLTRRGNRLYLSVSDQGCGIDNSTMGSIYARYQRESTLEDVRNGIGLGMILVRTTAALHGGALLIDHPSEIGTRVTMTMEIRHSKNVIQSPAFSIDYAGEWDHALLELSDCLSSDLYGFENIH